MKSLGKLALFLVALMLISAVPAESLNEGDVPVNPRDNNGKKWRVGYVESGNFANYPATLSALVRGMAELGWITGAGGLPYLKGQDDTRAMWDFLSSRDLGPYLEFAGNAYYTFQGIETGRRGEAAKTIVDRLNTERDVDLVIVMGTFAGQALVKEVQSVPLMVFSTSNAVQAGIVTSSQDSGRDNVWAHMDPDRYRQQLEVFHDIFAFKRLGMVYDDSVAGRTFAAVEDVEAVARERGFEIVRCTVKDNQPDKEVFLREIMEAHRKLAGEVDAMYISLYMDRKASMLPGLLSPFYENKIPVLAQQGAAEVRNGALMSVYRADFSGVGLFGAEAIARTLNGAKPRSLPQVYANTPNVALNLKVAGKINYRPPFEMLLVADEIFTNESD